jgi:hypothetical protein
MIHKPHLSIATLIWAFIVTSLLWFIPRLNHALDWLNFPALALAVIWSHFTGGNPHSPSNLVGWSAFAVYTIAYLLVLLILYATLWEIYLLHGVLHHLDDAKQNLTSEKPDSTQALANLGQAVAELEARRRRHFLLQHLDLPDFPPDQRHLLGAHAITRAGQTGPVKRLLKKLRSKLAAQTSPLQADALLTKLKNDARDLASQPPPNKNNH